MNLDTPFIVLSVDRVEYDENVNASRRDTFEHQLTHAGASFKRVSGHYAGASEVSYVVLTPEGSGMEALALRLARRYGQESVLLVSANRYAELAFLNPGNGGSDIARTQGAGFWREADQIEAQNAGAYTRDGERFYVTRPAP